MMTKECFLRGKNVYISSTFFQLITLEMDMKLPKSPKITSCLFRADLTRFYKSHILTILACCMYQTLIPKVYNPQYILCNTT